MLKEDYKIVLKTFGCLCVAAIMCFFIYFSVQFAWGAFFTKNESYTVYETVENGENTELYTFNLADGVDEQFTALEKQGKTVVKVYNRSKLTSGQELSANLICFAFTIVTLLFLNYNRIWTLGTNDNNKVKFGRVKEDKLKGLKIGLICSLPSFLLFVLAVLSRFGVLPQILFSVFKLANFHLFSINNIIFGTETTIALSQIPIWKFAVAFLPLLILPVICAVAYVLGYKDISLKDKLIYKDKKGKH
ncbi:MAG: hypothetical protein IJX79_00185 [Clostridia bacterium]|nr:hypothetical protein [Clostridia bacterium]